MMNITLPDGRKAEVIGPVTGKAVKIRLEDGRETLWPSDKIKPEKEGEDTLKVVIIPAIDRLMELEREMANLMMYGVAFDDPHGRLGKLQSELKQEAAKEFSNKWGLT